MGIFSRALKWRHDNKRREVFNVVEIIKIFATEQLIWFYLIGIISSLLNMWDQIWEWKYKYLKLPDEQLTNNKFVMGWT
jgi:hypothetical protein